MAYKHPASAAENSATKRRCLHSSSEILTTDRLTNDSFTVGWICALEFELTPSIAMLDEEFPSLPQIPGDPNTYTVGRIGDHNVVLACLPTGTTGTNATATVTAHMMRSFPNIRFGLMVGIGGGAPGMPCDDPRDDIRLGDVVVSCPTIDSSGVMQYDFGKTMTEGKFVQTGSLNKTSTALRTSISTLRAHHRRETSQISFHIDTMLDCNRMMRGRFSHPGLEHDQLFRSDYSHVEGQPTCDACDRKALFVRKPRTNEGPAIHYGLIGSANQVMKDGVTRERLRQEKGILCFEMEAAGLMDNLPCLVIRGICDYADSHKNKRWQPYAAAVAAAYAKEMLYAVPAVGVTLPSAIKVADIREMFRSLIDESNLEKLFWLLPVVMASQKMPAVPSLDSNDPKFSWVFRNMDYRSWKSIDGPLVLCLSSSELDHLSQVSSYMVHKEKEYSRLVLYLLRPHIEFTASQYGEHKDIEANGILIYILLAQIINSSPVEKRILILRHFIDGLMQEVFESERIQNWIDDGFDNKYDLRNLRHLLGNAASEDIAIMFLRVLDYVKPQPFLIVLDGIKMAYRGGQRFGLIVLLISHLRRQNPKLKILFTSPIECEITDLPLESLNIEHDKERKECLRSLRFENTRYEKISPEHGGSFQWIWTHNEYKSWSASDTSQLLYIQGKPGSGKSTLSKYFHSKFQSRVSDAREAIVAKFFYSFREGEAQRSHYNMLLSLLYDIVYQDEAFFYHHCQTIYRAHPDRSPDMTWKYASLKAVLESLQDYFTTKRIYLIIDAVDESDEVDRREILNLLYKLCSETKCCIKTFIASRPVPQMEARRQSLNFIRLQDETTTDISKFAHSFLNGLHLDTTHLLPQAIEYIVKNAQGVFLWVKLVGAELIKSHEDGFSQEQIFKLLKELPTELKNMYEHMLDKMEANSASVSLGLRMLRFVLLAKRPLTVDELLHSLGIQDNIGPKWVFNPSEAALQERIPSSERIIFSCGGNFLEIKLHEGNRVVQVIHQTAHEFLMDPHGAVAKSRFRIESGHAHLCIAITCIRYLLTCAANNSSITGLPDSQPRLSNQNEDFAKFLDKKPLISYVSVHLKAHIDDCWEYVNKDLQYQHLISQLTAGWIDKPFNFLLENWTGSHLTLHELEQVWLGMLIAAAKNGLIVAAEIVLSLGLDVDIQDGSGHTPISWAAENGHKAVVKLLLSKGADTWCQDNHTRTPFSWAARNGHKDITELLLTDVDLIEDKDDTGRTPLSWAAGNGHKDITKLLLTQGASIETRDNVGHTPLLWAVMNGHKDIIRLLLNVGAFIETKDNTGRTPLSWAAGNGYEDIIKLLLTRAALIENEDDTGCTPLSWATKNKQKTAVKLLLQIGADETP